MCKPSLYLVTCYLLFCYFLARYLNSSSTLGAFSLFKRCFFRTNLNDEAISLNIAHPICKTTPLEGHAMSWI